MSRIGKKKRVIPDGVAVTLQGSRLLVKGPKGELGLTLHPRVTVAVQEGHVEVKVANEASKQDRALWGTFSSIINNMLKGVTEGFKKQLEINGVGFKAQMKGPKLVLDVGFSHPVEVVPPAGITLSTEKNIISVEGADKHVVGETAAHIRDIKKPEPYKGKGIKYVDEIIRRKAGKTAAKSAA
ncbi:MAG: 50S ribosomal protein L6 [Candidatus Magasanikbacteria bacterium GW2011_GWA2_46_17]|uniref:Large ribosomal subunit protein uL6 n=1 Tax=Candidatus Magasanikbacteria bacterium GW2011_GWA2_46_17 TaxID=1619042 RepID=A0A0G1P407_9BACT|nr:MAG: 50S ribosomal protein L6 [Candidatus Magasanikbacteria bacterium GW2011_GWA2_46_17]